MYVANGGPHLTPAGLKGSTRACSPILSPPRSTSALPEQRNETSTATPAPTGYLGYTSYYSVYEETESVLMGSSLGSTTAVPDVECTAAAPSSETCQLSPATLDTCIKILDSLPDPAMGMECFRRPATPFDSFPHPIAVRILRSFYATFGQYLGRNRNPTQLEFVARRLCDNTAKSFSDTEPDAERWVSQLLDGNLRWESVGIFFTFWRGKKESCETLRRLVDVCTETSQGNSLLVYLSLKYTNAESCLSGDASKSPSPVKYLSISLSEKSYGSDLL